MRGVFINFVALLTQNTVSQRCVFFDLYTWFIYDTLYIRLKLADRGIRKKHDIIKQIGSLCSFIEEKVAKTSSSIFVLHQTKYKANIKTRLHSF